jgi:hypothetical protein
MSPILWRLHLILRQGINQRARPLRRLILRLPKNQPRPLRILPPRQSPQRIRSLPRRRQRNLRQ